MPAILDHPPDFPPVREKVASAAIGRLKNKNTTIYLVALVATLVLSPVLILAGASQGYAQVLASIAALVALILVPWKPILGLYLVVISAVVIEQEPLLSTPIGTDRLYVFYWPTKFQGLPERPLGFVILLVLFFIVAARLMARKHPLYGGKLFYPFMLFLGCVAIGALHGLASGGDSKIIVLEIRPFWYLFVSYILAYNVVTEVKHVRTIIWITVLGTAIKGIQGVYIVYTYLGGKIEGHNEIMAHEQSFFFVLVLLLLVMMLLHRFQRGLFIAILASLPCLLLALVANNRRADYVALLLGIGVAWVLVILVKPESRRKLIPVLAICVVLGAGYVLAFQKSDGALASPARAVISVFNPNASDERDAASNAYRKIENYDLKFTESQSPILGFGYGKPFLQPIPLPNVLELDPYYLFIPHNNILWIWMRLGPLGFGALWYLIGSAIVAGCIIARRLKNRELQFFAIFAIAVLMMEVILAYGDYQFFFYRNMIYVGVVLGVLMKLPAIARAASGETEKTHDELGDPDSHAPTRTRARARISIPLTLSVPVPVANVRAVGDSISGRWNGT